MKTIITILLFAFLTLSTHAQIITTIAGNGIEGYTGNGGQATDAEISGVSGIAVDEIGNFFLADYSNNVIRKVNTSGIISVIAGTGTAGFSGDGGPATAARLNCPRGLVTDRYGNLFFGDINNYRIRKINTIGIISTFAGNGDTTVGGDGGQATAASFEIPGVSAIDDSGNFYIVDGMNSRIRKINTSGIINTIAGTSTAGYSGDGGPATNAELEYIFGMCVDFAKNIYICDWGFNIIRKINSAGIISHFAGDPNCAAFDGDTGPAANACFHGIEGICCDWIGNVYIPDTYNERIRAVNTAGFINTIVGNPFFETIGDYYVGDFSGDGGPASLAKLNWPNIVVVDNLGNLYICDAMNNRIRKVWGAAAIVPSVLAGEETIQLFPNPNNGSFSVVLPAGASKAIITVTDIVGKVVEIITTQLNGKVNIDLGNVIPGTYLVRVETESGVYREKMVINAP